MTKIQDTVLFSANQCVPEDELRRRWARCRQAMALLPEEVGGVLIFSRTDIFYITGTLANGLCWLPREGEPVLLTRKGQARCQLESPLAHIVTYKSYSEVAVLCAEAGSPLSSTIAVDKRTVPWNMAKLLQAKMPKTRFVEGALVLAWARAVKSTYELARLQRAACTHRRALVEILPEYLQKNMSERQIAHKLWDICFALGHGGQLRTTHGEAPFLGSISAGENGNFPVSSISPTGLQGEHAAMPVMGYAGNLWQAGQILLVDTGFVVEGYHSDMTVSYWSGGQNSVPCAVQRAYDTCVEICTACAALLCPGVLARDVWQTAWNIAQKQQMLEGSMGLGHGQGGNHMPFIGHGIGLAMEEWPALVPQGDTLLQADMVIALEPKIGLAHVGMVGCERIFRVTAQGGLPLDGGAALPLICCG